VREWALGLLLVASLAGCASMPSGGPVLSYTVTPGPAGQSQPCTQAVAQHPRVGGTPEAIIYGFLAASANVCDPQLAREYLTPRFSRNWQPGWTARVFSKGPTVETPPSAEKENPKQKTATVIVGGKVQADLGAFGSYAVPLSTPQQAQSTVFYLTKNSAGQWRIDLPTQTNLPLLLDSNDFSNDYQPRNLYFFDPQLKYLVPDPVYVPLQDTAADLMQKLVLDLNKPLGDWLSGAATSAFPPGTKVGDVTTDGRTALVNLSGAQIGKADELTMRQVSAQLLATLSGSGQGGPAVKNVEVVVNGRPWIPKNSQDTPVQHTALFNPPKPAQSGMFYYLDGAGNLMDQVSPTSTPVLIQQNIGKAYSQIAISSGLNGPYIAALRANDNALFIGPVGGRLVQRGAATGYSSMSWDPNGNLWATTAGNQNQVVRLRGDATPGTPGYQPVSFTVVDAGHGIMNGSFPFTAIRVAPDGVRVALIVNGTALYFGAIDSPAAKIQLSPFSVPVPDGTTMFTAVTWYGNDNVITLGEPGQSLTEYPVNGGNSTDIPLQGGIQSITASEGYPLVAVANKGELGYLSSLTGNWAVISLGKGKLSSPPVYPG
jgi:hypothetical protein